ncbi:hypothetical protein OVN20_07515 [Microcella daejeonensis]|uniref:hypothetical protein n=1 Tax=Microcella daejeonensis TaxID=2994971 RepID=UPI00226DB72A|nr:hypothetical protein [Microcella daejeonensis]WAB82961.1 hypothetical protein OVN20_07515 [Microcella daejeonensis]
MSFLDRIFGARTPEPEPVPRAAPRSDDERAVERYRYLLETAPPATIEQVHAEAFAKLTPEQRQLVFQQLTATAPAGRPPPTTARRRSPRPRPAPSCGSPAPWSARSRAVGSKAAPPAVAPPDSAACSAPPCSARWRATWSAPLW